MTPENALFTAALGIQPPWEVTEVRYDEGKGELHLSLGFARGSRFACPVCGSPCPAYDTTDRTWRHLNFFEHPTYLHASQPRVSCDECGTKVVDLPWARPNSGFTLLFEALMLILSKQMPVAGVARMVGENQMRVWRVLEHYVSDARSRQSMGGVRRVGVDETSSKSGHEYVTVFADLDERKVLFVTEGKDQGTLTAFREDLLEHQGDPKQVEALSMDLSAAFQAGAAAEFPNAEVVFDRYHVVRLVNDAVDAIRRAEVKENDALKKSRYLWLKNPGKLTSVQKERIEELKAMNLATATAYQMKLSLQQLWDQPDRASAEAYLNTWYEWVSTSSLGQPMKRAANTIKAHATGILNHYNQRISNGLMEGINSLIQAAKAKARGYRNTAYLRTIVYLIAGKLRFDLPAWALRCTA